MASLTVAFDASLPHARWGPLFHVFRLERRDVELQWHPVGFPASGQPAIDGADVGVFIQPQVRDGLDALTLDSSPMAVVMGVGHPLADKAELTVADVLDQPFPGGPDRDPVWSAFWTLDEQRGAPALRTDDEVHDAEEGLEAIAAGSAIATVPLWVANGLAHPGVVALPLTDGPPVLTRLVWRRDEANPAVHWLVELAQAWTSRGNPQRPGTGRGDG
jgi:DNA-binding transcriptional LysR family regulator